MDTPSIRLATEQDIDELIALYAEFHEFHVLGVPDRLRKPDTYDKAALSGSLRAILSRDDAAIFVLDTGKNLIGLAEVYIRQDEHHPLTVAHRYGFLQSLIVSAQHRKSGLGRRLVATAHQWAKERSATEMQLRAWEFAEGPLHFYEALGYRTLKRHLVIDLP
jgi:GNAT superfamily N-acetyltransferase